MYCRFEFGDIMKKIIVILFLANLFAQDYTLPSNKYRFFLDDMKRLDHLGIDGEIVKKEIIKLVDSFREESTFPITYKEILPAVTEEVPTGEPNRVDQSTYNQWYAYYVDNMGDSWARAEAKRLATYTPSKTILVSPEREITKNRLIEQGGVTAVKDAEWSDVIKFYGGYAETNKKGISKKDLKKFTIEAKLRNIELVSPNECYFNIRLYGDKNYAFKFHNISKIDYKYPATYQIQEVDASDIYNSTIPQVTFSFEKKEYLNKGQPIYSTKPIVGALVKDLPAERAGILPGDKILKINNLEILTWADLVKAIHPHPDKELNIKIEREGKIKDLNIKTISSDFSGRKIGITGIRPVVKEKNKSAITLPLKTLLDKRSLPFNIEKYKTTLIQIFDDFISDSKYSQLDVILELKTENKKKNEEQRLSGLAVEPLRKEGRKIIEKDFRKKDYRDGNGRVSGFTIEAHHPYLYGTKWHKCGYTNVMQPMRCSNADYFDKLPYYEVQAELIAMKNHIKERKEAAQLTPSDYLILGGCGYLTYLLVSLII